MGSENKEFKFKLSAKAGYLFSDDWMALGEVGYEHHEHMSDGVVIGAAARHYFSKNGLFVGAGLKYKHAEAYNDLLPGIHAGYAFFLTRTVTLEPELYFDISTKSSSSISTFLPRALISTLTACASALVSICSKISINSRDNKLC